MGSCDIIPLMQKSTCPLCYLTPDAHIYNYIYKKTDCLPTCSLTSPNMLHIYLKLVPTCSMLPCNMQHATWSQFGPNLVPTYSVSKLKKNWKPLSYMWVCGEGLLYSKLSARQEPARSSEHLVGIFCFSVYWGWGGGVIKVYIGMLHAHMINLLSLRLFEKVRKIRLRTNGRTDGRTDGRKE